MGKMTKRRKLVVRGNNFDQLEQRILMATTPWEAATVSGNLNTPGEASSY